MSDTIGVDEITSWNYRNLENRMGAYLKNIGDEFNNDTCTIATLLHEVGHLVRVEVFASINKFREMKDFDLAQMHTIKLAVGRETNEKYRIEKGIDLTYYLSGNEIHSDNFVYINYPKIRAAFNKVVDL